MLRNLLLAGAVSFSAVASGADLPSPRPLHPPVTQETPNTTPRPYTYVEPPLLNVPSQEPLRTVTVKDRTYTINKVGKVSFKPEEKASNRDFPGAQSDIDKLDQSLVFIGSGRGGRESRDRLAIENCTFVMDFTEGDFERWDERRGAVYVEGYREVIVRNCVFVSKAQGDDPERKVTGSIIAYDCLKVQIDNCYFHGRTLGWRGHIIAYCCGPTEIRNVEIDAGGKPSGGIWVATGVGEGKIGWMHENNPELIIYPAGPLRVENALVRNQKGRENADGIYVQSVHPYLIRNCRVEDWGPDDSLIDVGFRDTAPKTYQGKPLINHGGVGVIEHCEFEKGWIKNSVGLAGGLVFRNNLLKRGTWLFPYAFDGGTWWVVSNRFENMSGVIVSGRNNQFDGWTPKEGMFTNGAKMRLLNNVFHATDSVPGLYAAGAKPAPLSKTIVADFNLYQMPAPKLWGKDTDTDYATFDAWQSATGNDQHSLVGEGSLSAFAGQPAVELSGGLKLTFGEAKVGLLGAVGVRDEAVLRRARETTAAVERDMASRQFALQTETLDIAETSLAASVEKRSWAGGGAYLTLKSNAAGQSVNLRFKIDREGRYSIGSNVAIPGKARWQVQIDGKPIGTPVELGRKGSVVHGDTDLTAGEHVLTYTALDEGATASLDEVRFRDAEDVDQDRARRKAFDDARLAAAAARKALEAATLHFDFTKLQQSDLVRSKLGEYGPDDKRYLLWQPSASKASVTFKFLVERDGDYHPVIRLTQQTDRMPLTVSIDDQVVGRVTNVEPVMKFDAIHLTPNEHTLTLHIDELAAPAKLRLADFGLQPAR